MAIDCGFVVGYGGYAMISSCVPVNGNWVLKRSDETFIEPPAVSYKFVRVLSASITRDLNIPTANSFFLPYDLSNNALKNKNKNLYAPLRLGFGTYTFNGQISMEVSKGILETFFDAKNNFFKRNTVFNIEFYDGNQVCKIINCVWSSIKISSSTGGIANMSISFQSNNGGFNNLYIQELEKSMVYSVDEDDFVVPYWKTGLSWEEQENLSDGGGGEQEPLNDGEDEEQEEPKGKMEVFLNDVIDFSFGLDRSVTPIFLNNRLFSPTYLRAGLINASLNITSLTTIDFYDESSLIIHLGFKKITMMVSYLKNQSFSNASLNDIGNKTYQFTFFAKNDKFNGRGQEDNEGMGGYDPGYGGDEGEGQEQSLDSLILIDNASSDITNFISITDDDSLNSDLNIYDQDIKYNDDDQDINY